MEGSRRRMAVEGAARLSVCAVGLVLALAGCESHAEQRQRQVNEEQYRHQQEEIARAKRIEQEQAEQGEKGKKDMAEARPKYLAARDAALKGEIVDVKLVDVMNAPDTYKGKVVRFSARWTTFGPGSHGDELSTQPVMLCELSPPLRTKPTTILALDEQDRRERMPFYEGLERGEVDVVARITGKPLAVQLPAIGRVLDVRAR